MSTQKLPKLDEFTRAYIEAALWSSTDESEERGGQPMDENYDITDLAPECLDKMVTDCTRFQRENAEHITEDTCLGRGGNDYDPSEMAGHDFWLTRNHHGSGFWDGDWAEPAATKLTNASEAFKECYLCVGDDGLIYCS